jgi:hypothetical protein
LLLGYVSHCRIGQTLLTSAKQQRPSAGLATSKIKKFCVSKKLTHIDDVEIQANLSKLQPRHRMEMSDQLHAPVVLPTGMKPRTN